MEDSVSYLLKSAVWLTGFAIVYLVFLRKERFFILKRIYLIAGILISFIFPLITINYSVDIPAPLPQVMTEIIPDVGVPAAAPATKSKSFNYMYMVAGIYLSGILFLLVRNILHFSRLCKAMRKSKIDNLGTARLIRTSEYTSSFSFFNYVFVNPSVCDDEVKEIMNHELVHVDQKHWLDLLLGEFLRMLQWANPFAWIYTGFIRLNHEYLADEVALQRSSDPALYKAALLNQVFRAPVISLSNSFNYSITKTRFDMMKKIVSSPYRKLKVLFIIPVFAIILYAFSTPEYHYTKSIDNSSATLTIYEASPVKAEAIAPKQNGILPAVFQQGVKGTVRDADGKPVPGAILVATGTTSNAPATTDKDGNFNLQNVPKDVAVLVSAPGFKGIIVKPDYGKPMEIRLEKDPDYKFIAQAARPEPLVIIDGQISEIKYSEIRKELGHNMGTTNMLQGKLATDKYGEKAANGVIEVITRKKALEMGLNPPYPRIDPEDFPTFQSNPHYTFMKWVSDRVTYPEEARSKNIEGWVTVSYTIQKDGSISIGQAGNESLQVLSNEIIRVINSAPNFEPPKNVEANEPLTSSITIGFKLPDQVLRDPPFVVVESMPMYPGGDAALLQFIKENTNYPEELKKEKIEGRVIVRFMVTPDGTVDGISVLKGVHPLIDAEAIRLVQQLKGWKPGMQGGKPVNVWYMVPVTFTPPAE